VTGASSWNYIRDYFLYILSFSFSFAFSLISYPVVRMKYFGLVLFLLNVVCSVVGWLGCCFVLSVQEAAVSVGHKDSVKGK
jgi:hypothetical protein